MALAEDFIARAYQVDLYERAVKENTIIYLPTGTGKTYIAVMVVKALSASIQKPYSRQGKRTIFAVNTIPLVSQQTEYLARHTGLRSKGFSGDMQVDYWTKEKWLEEIEETPILVMTAQIFVDILNHGIMSLDRVNLIIFDECHRAVNDHPMRQIMQRFKEYPKINLPRVLALSATLLNSNVKIDKVEQTIESLEVTFQSRVASVPSTACVAGYSTNPKESIVLHSPHKKSPLEPAVNTILTEAVEILKVVKLSQPSDNNDSSTIFKPKAKGEKLMNILKDIDENLQLTGIYGGSKSVLLHMVQLESLKRILGDQQTSLVLEYLLTKMMIIRKLFDKEMEGLTEMEQIYQFSSNKVLKLFAILKDFNDNKSKDQQFCCIIFVKRRFTAKVLYHVLKSLHKADERYKFLLAEFMVGYTNDPYKNAKEVLCISRWNKEVLQKFRSGKSNCIVATDVVDEGVDIPACTLIVRFDLPLDFRAYVQSKGRARHSTSQYTMIMSSDDDKFESRYKQFQKTESFLQRILLGKTDLRSRPTDKNIADELYTYTIEPYLHHSADGTPCLITEQSAISLLNRYCANLYKSKFISLAPTWILHKRPDENLMQKYQVSLQLPTISPLKGIIWGDLMPSIDDAKRSVAVKTCIKLKEIGELNDHLNPIDPDVIQENVDYLFPNWIEEEKTENCAPGTNSKKRKHDLIHAEPLFASFPVENTILFLHILEMKPSYSVPHDNRRLVFYNLLKKNSGYGILSTKQFPKIPSFPIFMNVGSLQVQVKVNHLQIRLEREQIKLLKKFHTMLFSDIVKVIKSFMVFDNMNLENSFAVVPVKENWDIDWDVINQYQTIEARSPSTPFEVTESEYNLALVSPSYRGAQSIYIVTMICDDLTAESSFPTEDFYSYLHYFKDRHGLNIQNPKQQMLEVKPISTQINCIKPRGVKPGLSKRRRADLLEEFEEHLVPELCNKINFPALYWLKATTLPSVLHRITQLLTAECLRQQIEVEAKVKTSCPTDSWSPLIITENDEKKETAPDVTLDESIELDVSELQPEISGPEIDEAEYPWSKEEEPVDLHRDVDRIQLIDIEYYYKFMGQWTDQNGKEIKRNDMLKPKEGTVYMSRPNVTVPRVKMLSDVDLEGPDPIIVMKALTSKIGNDCFDLERLETLGDSFLKFAVSLYLYDTFKSFNEGQLTALKGKMIGNRNLFYCGVNKGISGRLKVEDFSPMSNFITPAYAVERRLQAVLVANEISPNVLYELHVPPEERYSGYVSESTMDRIQETVLDWKDKPTHTGMEHFLGKQTVPDKVVADSVEAIIGAYLYSSGTEGAVNILNWFGIIPTKIEIKGPSISQCQAAKYENVDEHMPWADLIETKLNYKFNDRTHLLQAFSHPSYSANGVTPCYQRLEFLGDAVLDFLITVYIYEYCGELSPGDLTDLRSALVNNITFACLAVRYGLHTALLSYVPLLHEIINRFVKFQEERNHAIDDELLWILLEEDECNLAEHVDVPKVLGDIFESFIGAIYIDSGKDLLKVWQIVYSLMHIEFELFCATVPKQPVRVIYETQGARPIFLKAKQIESTGQVMVPLEVTIHGKQRLFHGFGANKKQAKSAAAKQALKCFRCSK
ncbi:endoribonuclease Dicer isoform X2 [Belonocnema kinseyi]|uniref:endoribonuclease Dicer isoform X2 n=1 Tax=Belonocnema kinseyi TaxID=2817044 RepID=UPI00143CDA54|nr:endoribonuclease Dicer isoform X2 [Belonocnema kinseyi]